MNQPKESRRNRLRPNPGMWTPLSIDFGRIICIELADSKKRTDKKQINRVPICAIPIMLAYIRALAIEIENQKEYLKKVVYTSKLLKSIEAKPTNEIMMICKYYKTTKAIKQDSELLNHIRHEIIHPAPYPEKGYKLPVYLHKLYSRGLLWKPPSGLSACNIIDFFSSHELLKWAAITITDIAENILNSDTQYKHLNTTHYDLIEEIRKKTI